MASFASEDTGRPVARGRAGRTLLPRFLTASRPGTGARAPLPAGQAFHHRPALPSLAGGPPWRPHSHQGDGVGGAGCQAAHVLPTLDEEVPGRTERARPGWGFLTTALSGMFYCSPRSDSRGEGLAYRQETADLTLDNFPSRPSGCRIVSTPAVPTIYRGSLAPTRPSLSDRIVTGPPRTRGLPADTTEPLRGVHLGPLVPAPCPWERL